MGNIKGAIMSTEKLQSGHYRIRCLVGGKRISITTAKKPSKAEEAMLIQEYIQAHHIVKDKANKPFILQKNIFPQKKMSFQPLQSEDIRQLYPASPNHSRIYSFILLSNMTLLR